MLNLILMSLCYKVNHNMRIIRRLFDELSMESYCNRGALLDYHRYIGLYFYGLFA
jgi:DNA-directed RNA polymerase subunit N (RpoN/RPB10)